MSDNRGRTSMFFPLWGAGGGGGLVCKNTNKIIARQMSLKNNPARSKCRKISPQKHMGWAKSMQARSQPPPHHFSNGSPQKEEIRIKKIKIKKLRLRSRAFFPHYH